MDSNKKPASINLILSSLRYFYKNIVKRDILINIKSQKKEKKIPVVLTKEEVNRLIKVTKNKKHKLMIELMYSAGLRVSECVKLKVKDIHFDENIINIHSGKGKKDRISLLGKKTSENIKFYLDFRDEESEFLFAGRDVSKNISVKMAQKLIKESAVKAGIKKNVFCHALRSSFATSLLDDGVDIRYIQSLLGHENLSTTEIYTKVSKKALKKIKSPIDD